MSRTRLFARETCLQFPLNKWLNRVTD